MTDGVILGTQRLSLPLAGLILISSFNFVEVHVNSSVSSIPATVGTLFMRPSSEHWVAGERGRCYSLSFCPSIIERFLCSDVLCWVFS